MSGRVFAPRCVPVLAVLLWVDRCCDESFACGLAGAGGDGCFHSVVGDGLGAVYFTSSDELQIGTYNGGSAKARTVFAIDTSVLKGKVVKSATLKLWDWHSYSCSASTWTVYHTFSPDSKTTWADQGTWYSAGGSSSQTKGYSSSCAEGWVSANVTDLATMFSNTTDTTQGFGIRASESSNAGWKRFWSGNHSSGKPTFTVNYNSYPKTPTKLAVADTVSWSGADYALTQKPKLSAVVSDPDGGNVKGRFQVFNSSTMNSSTLVAECVSGNVVSGAKASCTLTTALTNGGTYWVRVKADDGSLMGAWSGSVSFKVDVNAPAAPSITSSAYSTSGAWLDTAPSSNTFTFSVAAADVTKFQYRFDAGSWATGTAAGSGTTKTFQRAWNPTSGKHTVEARAVDAFGHVGSSAQFSFGTGPAALSAPANETVVTGPVNVKASAHPVISGTASAKTLYRLAGATAWTEIPESSKSVTTGAYSATVDLSSLTDLDARKFARIQIEVCFTYSAGAVTQCTWNGSSSSVQPTVLKVPHAFGDNFPTTDAGPGQVALWTGEYSMNASDVSVPGYVGDLSLSRTYSTLGDNTGTAGPGSVFGPGWSASFDGTDVGVAGLR